MDDLTILVISHNLAVVRLVADKVAVMRSGRIVEIAAAASIFERPQHAYTQDLIRSWPSLRS